MKAWFYAVSLLAVCPPSAWAVDLAMPKIRGLTCKTSDEIVRVSGVRTSHAKPLILSLSLEGFGSRYFVRQGLHFDSKTLSPFEGPILEFFADGQRTGMSIDMLRIVVQEATGKALVGNPFYVTLNPDRTETPKFPELTCEIEQFAKRKAKSRRAR